MKYIVSIYWLIFLFSITWLNDIHAQSSPIVRYISPVRFQFVFNGPLRRMKEPEKSALTDAVRLETDRLQRKCASELFVKDSTIYEDFLTNLDSLDWLRITNIMFDAKIIFDTKKKRYIRKGERVLSLWFTHPALFTQRSRVVMEIIYQKHPELKLRKKGFLMIPFGFCEYAGFDPYSTAELKGLLGNLVLDLETNKIGCNVGYVAFNYNNLLQAKHEYFCPLLRH